MLKTAGDEVDEVTGGEVAETFAVDALVASVLARSLNLRAGSRTARRPALHMNAMSGRMPGSSGGMSGGR